MGKEETPKKKRYGAKRKKDKSILINADIHARMKEYCLLRGATIKKFITHVISLYEEDMGKGIQLDSVWDLPSSDKADSSYKSILLSLEQHTDIAKFAKKRRMKMKSFVEQAINRYIDVNTNKKK